MQQAKRVSLPLQSHVVERRLLDQLGTDTKDGLYQDQKEDSKAKLVMDIRMWSGISGYGAGQCSLGKQHSHTRTDLGLSELHCLAQR